MAEKISASEKSIKRREVMLTGNLLKVIPIIALPQVATMLIDAFYNLTDTYFVSQLGETATAAVGVNDSLMQIIRSIAITFGMGMSSYLSRLLGAKKDKEASRAASTTLFTALAVVALVSIIAYIFVSPLVTFLGATEGSKAYSMDYARWILVFSPFTAGTVCLSQSLRGEGSTTYSMIGTVSGCFINLALDPLFILGFGMEVAGAAIATGISKVISFLVLLIPYLTGRSILSISIKHFKPSKQLYGEIARMGIPTGVRTGMMTIGAIVVNNVAAGFGDIALAAVSVANKCMRLVSSAVLGFGQGFQPIAGYCWGAKLYGRAKKAFYYTIAIGVLISIVLGVILAIFAQQVLSVFSADGDMMNIGVLLIRSQCLVLPMHVSVMVITGLFQATGKALKAGLLGLTRQLFSLIPCVLILSAVFGLQGLAWSQAVADVIAFVLSLMLTIPMLKEMTRLDLAERVKENE